MEDNVGVELRLIVNDSVCTDNYDLLLSNLIRLIDSFGDDSLEVEDIRWFDREWWWRKMLLLLVAQTSNKGINNDNNGSSFFARVCEGF